jgi:hypothetical protein
MVMTPERSGCRHAIEIRDCKSFYYDFMPTY